MKAVFIFKFLCDHLKSEFLMCTNKYFMIVRLLFIIQYASYRPTIIMWKSDF